MSKAPKPAPVTGRCAWKGKELKQSPFWERAWTKTELAEVERALRTAKRSSLGWREITKNDFPLPDTSAFLQAIADELEDGYGAVKLVGFPVERFDPEDLRLIWSGLCRHLGQPVYQDSQGQMMREIRNEGGDLGARHGRLGSGDGGKEFLSSKARTYSDGELRFHTDRTDVVALLNVEQAKSGGVSKVASSAAVHNEILRRRPDLLEVLYRPYYRSRLGEEAGGDHVVYPLPVFGLRDGKLTSHYSRTYIEAAQRLSETPGMTEAQWEAIELLAGVAEELSVKMRLDRGDMQFLNSHVTYHARTSFEDDPASAQVRCLWRFWICMPNNRTLPEDHAVLWRNVGTGGLRGGIGQAPISATV